MTRVRIASTLIAHSALAVMERPAHAQWTATSLDPAGSEGSFAHGLSGTHQVGARVLGGFSHAGLWNSSADSWVDLQPAAATESVAWATFGSQQVGFAVLPGGVHGGAWNGTAESWIDLHPAGSAYSEVRGTNGAQQVGVVDGQASLWHGTAASWVSLHVPGSQWSSAVGTNGVQQVGFAAFGDPRQPNRPIHAFLWSDTADSGVNLTPPGVHRSIAWGISDTQQVGSIGISIDGLGGVGGMGFILHHASLWSGTAASCVDLNPAWATESVAYATFDIWQAGAAVYQDGGGNHAGIWSGSAESWEDLSLALTGSWGASYATGIWSDGSTLSVTGYGFNLDTGRTEALLWTRPVPAPAAVAVLSLGGLVAARRRRGGPAPHLAVGTTGVPAGFRESARSQNGGFR